MSIFKLNSKQEKAFNRLQRAYKDCEKEGVYFANLYGMLMAFDKSIVKSYSFQSDINTEDSVNVLDAGTTHNYIRIPGEFCDDSNLHAYELTEMGKKIYSVGK